MLCSIQKYKNITISKEKLVEMDVKYTWILGQGKNFRHFWLANMELIYWPVRSSSRRGGDVVKGVEGRNRYFSQLQVLLLST